MHGYNWTATETNSNFSETQTPKSSTKWLIFCMDSYACQCFTRFNFRSFIFLDIHQWPCWRHFINCQITCRWYIHLLCCQWHQCTSWPNEIGFRKVASVGLSVENVIHPNVSKQAQQITYSKKKSNFSHSPHFFNKTNMVGCSYQKYLGVYPDKNLSFNTISKKKLQNQV